MTLFALARPLIFRTDPERAHRLTIRALSLGLAPAAAPPPGLLRTGIAGLTLPSPLCLAAGFDKDAEVWRGMLALGFGGAEVGTLTPRPQHGNPRPRIFRLPEDEAVINRLGFNNGGLDAALPRLEPNPRLGVNVGANKDSTDRIADYAHGVRRVRDRAGWITLNISSPNTPGLRALQGDELADLLDAALEARGPGGPPVFLKVAPDLTEEAMDHVADTVLARGVGALIIGNTTITRPDSLRSAAREEAGGLSGQPLTALALEKLRGFARRLGGRVPLVAAGGIATPEQAYARIRAGASMVQLYTAMVYEGPGLPARLNRGLAALLARDGFGSVADAVGADTR